MMSRVLEHVCDSTRATLRVSAAEERSSASPEIKERLRFGWLQQHVESRHIHAPLHTEGFFGARPAPVRRVEPFAVSYAVCKRAHATECDECESHEPAGMIRNQWNTE